jgi:hypothetical protein
MGEGSQAMRDLRVELQHQDDNGPVVWKPARGDILVGTVRDASSIQGPDTSNTVVVVEERTGVPVLVSLDSPRLAAHFELHKPQPNERIGIKCSGEDQFIVVIDRDPEPITTAVADSPSQQVPDAQSPSSDDCATATPEERNFIEKIFLDGSPVSEPEWDDQHDDSPAHIQGTIGRSVEELDRQTKTLERLEALIIQSLPQPSAPVKPPATEAGPQPETHPQSPQVIAAATCIQATPKPRKSWLRALLITLALVSASAAGVGYAHLDQILKWVSR